MFYQVEGQPHPQGKRRQARSGEQQRNRGKQQQERRIHEGGIAAQFAEFIEFQRHLRMQNDAPQRQVGIGGDQHDSPQRKRKGHAPAGKVQAERQTENQQVQQQDRQKRASTR